MEDYYLLSKGKASNFLCAINKDALFPKLRLSKVALIKVWVHSKVDFTRNIMTDSIYTENDQEFQIPETGFQFLNLCREWAILDQKDLYSKYTKLSKTAIKQLASIPVINQQLKNADFFVFFV